MPALVFTSLIAWLSANMFICVWTPLTDKSVSASMQENNKHDKYAVND